MLGYIIAGIIGGLIGVLLFALILVNDDDGR